MRAVRHKGKGIRKTTTALYIKLLNDHSVCHNNKNTNSHKKQVTTISHWLVNKPK